VNAKDYNPDGARMTAARMGLPDDIATEVVESKIPEIVLP
jgi:hypothetical protein